MAKELPNYDYWIAKTYILLADDYVALKDNFQAKATLQSILDNYKGNDDILATAQQKLNRITGKNDAPPAQQTQPDTTQNAQPDSTKVKPAGNGN